jgi:ribosomal protein L37AE/L43A
MTDTFGDVVSLEVRWEAMTVEEVRRDDISCASTEGRKVQREKIRRWRPREM